MVPPPEALFFSLSMLSLPETVGDGEQWWLEPGLFASAVFGAILGTTGPRSAGVPGSCFWRGSEKSGHPGDSLPLETAGSSSLDGIVESRRCRLFLSSRKLTCTPEERPHASTSTNKGSDCFSSKKRGLRNGATLPSMQHSVLFFFFFLRVTSLKDEKRRSEAPLLRKRMLRVFSCSPRRP